MNDALSLYAARLREWNPKINLVGPETLARLETRHFKDCLQLTQYLSKSSTLKILDLGSGAGLPGLVLALACPQHQITLVESDSRKCAFLYTIIQELKINNAQIAQTRLEKFSSPTLYQVITARAFAPLPKILILSQKLLAPQGSWLLLKGKAVDDEIRACETLFPVTISRWRSMIQEPEDEQGWVINIKIKDI
jgi:16S rRNA (guanine527-N7)-methyltransferase